MRAGEPFAAAAISRDRTAQTQSRLCLQKKRGGCLAKLKVVFKNQHRGQRRHEIINLSLPLVQPLCVSEQVVPRFSGPDTLTSFIHASAEQYVISLNTRTLIS